MENKAVNVANKIMYHISRENNWNIGDVLIAGERENQFWSSCKDYSPRVIVDGKEMSIFQMIDQVSNFEVTQNNITFLYQKLKDVSKEMAFYIREQIFEDVRSKHYPMLPSRQKCLWVCEEDQIAYWKTMKEDCQRSLLTLELNGELFCGDDHWLTADTFSSVDYTDRAKHYWNGEMSDAPRKEFLFYGKAIIKEIISIKALR